MTGDPASPNSTTTWCASARLAAYGLLALAVLAGATTPASAEDLRGRWYFGGNISFLTTTDDVRSNATLNIGPAGDDGIPFTGDPNEAVRCVETGGFSNVYCDPRPDHLLAREMTIEETFKLDLTGGYGMTSWLSLQVDASYFKGDVGPVDAFARQFFPLPADPNGLNVVPTTMARSEESFGVIVGQITEIPVSITGVVRFRKDSTLNPYVGIGAGIIFAEMDVSGDVGALNERLGLMRIKGAANEFDDNITPSGGITDTAEGTVPFTFPLVVDVDDAFEWHVMGGAEYFFNDRFSMVFDARYMFADQSVQLRFGDQDQVNLQIFPEQLFRPDGSVKFFNSNMGAGSGGQAPNPLCVDRPNALTFPANQQQGPGCPEGNTNPTVHVSCSPGSVYPDLDGDGVRAMDPDVCYDKNIHTSSAFTGLNQAYGEVVVQGGEIDLTGFSVAVGVRFHF